MTIAVADQESVDNLVESWAAIAPLVAAVRARTPLTTTQVMLLMALCEMTDPDDNAPWRENA